MWNLILLVMHVEGKSLVSIYRQSFLILHFQNFAYILLNAWNQTLILWIKLRVSLRGNVYHIKPSFFSNKHQPQ